MNRRHVLIGSLIGCGGLAIFAVLLAVAVGIGANIGMQKAKDQAKTEGTTTGETTNTPSTQKAESMQFIPIVLRVSGEQGTRYHCIYNTEALEGGEIVSYSTSEDGTLGRQPVDYHAQIVSESPNRPPSGRTFRASCNIGPPTDPSSGNRGRLKAEVLVNDVVKDSDETRPDPPNKTSAQGTSVTVEYFEPCDGPLPKGKGKVDAKVKGKDYC